MANSPKKRKAPIRTAPVVEELVEALKRDSSIHVESAVLEGDKAVIILQGGGGRVDMRLLPLCDRPHYAKTGNFIVYYQGSGELDDKSRSLMERAVSVLVETEARHPGLPAEWPPALPRKIILAPGPRDTESEGSSDGNGPVVVNRWEDPRTGTKSLEVTLRVWNRCNQRCGFCQVEDRRWVLSPALIAKTIEEYGSGGVPVRLNITGGEPTLNPRLHEYVKSALRGKYSNVLVQTNAVRYADRRFAKRAPSSDRLLFFVSFHGFDETTYNEATNTKGQYQKAVDGINNLLACGHKVTLNVVFTSGNLSSFPGLVKNIPLLFPRYRDGLELQLSAVGGFPGLSGRMHLLPRLTEVYKVTRTAISEAGRIGVRVYDFATSGFCTLPPCILSGKQRRSIRGLMANLSDFGPIEVVCGRIDENGSSLIKSPVCEACIFNNSCPGVLRQYGLVFGLGELKAVKK